MILAYPDTPKDKTCCVEKYEEKMGKVRLDYWNPIL